MVTEYSFAPMPIWQREDVLCDLACYRLRDPSDPEDQGSLYPDPECIVHWAPVAYGMRDLLLEQRMERHRQWKSLGFDE